MEFRLFVLFALKITISLRSVRSVSQMLNIDCKVWGNHLCRVLGGRCEPASNKCMCEEGTYVHSSTFSCISAKKLGESCIEDAQCEYKDVNSYCDSPTSKGYAFLPRCICKPNHSIEIINATKKCVRVQGRKRGQSCADDAHCDQKDVNSYCASLPGNPYDLVVKCICKPNYHIEINAAKKCRRSQVPVDNSVQEIKGRLTAVPIVLCFMACVVIVVLFLLALRYWKKHQAAELEHQQALLQIRPITTTIAPSQQSPFGSLTLNLHDSCTLSNESCSPPPYSSIDMPNNRTSENEEPPPSYEEAVKNAERLQQGNS